MRAELIRHAPYRAYNAGMKMVALTLQTRRVFAEWITCAPSPLFFRDNNYLAEARRAGGSTPHPPRQSRKQPPRLNRGRSGTWSNRRLHRRANLRPPGGGTPALAQGTIILPNAAQAFGTIGETVLPHPPEKTRRAERLWL